jgi:peptidoglycan/xylan/chitin deacetylase (PgdA/CDA1 family)
LSYYLHELPVFGPAPTPIRVDLQHTAGHAAFYARIPTTQNVAFLTIDDGIVQLPYDAALLKASGIHVTLFLTTNFISSNKGYFATIQSLGDPIEGHTVSHPELKLMTYAQQSYQLCHGADLLGQWYGARPTIFRPPFGDENDTTLQAAWDCGLKAGFFWKETVNAGIVRFQTSNHVVQPGDIILMHFRSTFAEDLVAALQAIKSAGLVPAILTDYVNIDGSPV